MKALSDQSRLKIIKILAQKELCVCELTALLELAQPTVSKHLKNLEDAGLIESKRVGPWVNYKLSKGDETIYAKTMLNNMATWLDDDPEIIKMISKISQINRERICAV